MIKLLISIIISISLALLKDIEKEAAPNLI